MKIKHLLFLSLLSAAVITSCNPSKKGEDKTEANQSEKKEQEITLTKAPDSPQYPEAELTKQSLTKTPADSGYVVAYEFGVANYELGAQTADAQTKGIANSGKGQHIHYIVNNGPYSAHYMPGVNNVLDKGNYVVLAFLSRSYHESVKNSTAFHIENLTVGDVPPRETDLSTPHLFYSRPKGTYKGNDTKKVMLDFYLLNTTLSSEGNKVKATINNKEFLVDQWAPYYIEGLPLGTNTITLELIDATGNTIPGPFNKVTRTISLEE